MKTTVEISDSLLEQARDIAAREKSSVRALIEEGLRVVVADRQKRRQRFKLRKVSVAGQGLSPEFAEASWDQVRAAIYE